MQKMVGASPEERALSPSGFAIRRRLPWLHINLLTAFLAAAVVGLFESLIVQFTALAVLLPVVAGQSGNAGAQALAVTMRGLALREVGIRQWRGVLGKEVRDCRKSGNGVFILPVRIAEGGSVAQVVVHCCHGPCVAGIVRSQHVVAGQDRRSRDSLCYAV